MMLLISLLILWIVVIPATIVSAVGFAAARRGRDRPGRARVAVGASRRPSAV
jgi:hypothetical protein